MFIKMKSSTADRLFNISPSERKTCIIFCALAFLWSMGVMCGDKLLEVLFLIHVGADALPTIYLMIPLAIILSSLLMLKGYNIYSSQKIFTLIIVSAIAFYSFVYLLIHLEFTTDKPGVWYALRVCSYVIYNAFFTSFWTYVDQYHNLQDAKRLFSLYNAALFLGLAFAGILINSQWLSIEMMYFSVVAVLLLSLAYITCISRFLEPTDDSSSGEAKQPADCGSIRNLIKAILTSRFTLFLLCADFTVQLLQWVTEYNYMSDFERMFLPSSSPEASVAFTSFLGQCIATVGVFNLILGLFFYSRIVKRVGVNNLEIITPTAFFLLFLGWSWIPGAMLFPVLGYFIAEGLIRVIDENDFNLLLNAVPSKVKYKVRVIIESFFEPLGMLCSGFLLSIPYINSKTLGLTLAFFLVFIVLGIRSTYLQAIYKNLSDSTVDFRLCTMDCLKTFKQKETCECHENLFQEVQDGNEASQILAAEILIAYEDAKLLSKLLLLLKQSCERVKTACIRVIDKSPFASEILFLEHLEQWLRQKPQTELYGAIVFHLAKHGLLHPEKGRPLLSSTNPRIQAAGMIALLDSTVLEERILAMNLVEKALLSIDDESICTGLAVLSLRPQLQHIDMILPFLQHKSTVVLRHAAKALALVMNDLSVSKHYCIVYQDKLLSLLLDTHDQKVRLALLEAISAIGDSTCVAKLIQSCIHFCPAERRCVEKIITNMGPKTVPKLLSIAKNPEEHPRSRILSGNILGALAPPQLQANLLPILKNEIFRSFFYFYHAHRIQEQHPEFDLANLKEALLLNHQSTIDFIIQILAVSGSIKNGEILSRSLRHPSAKIRSQAIETIEKNCPPNVFDLLEPLICEHSIETKIQIYLKATYPALNLNDLLDKLSASSSEANNLIAATVKRRFNLAGWRSKLKKQMPSHSKLFQDIAYELLET
jgi:hypothetical protein